MDRLSVQATVAKLVERGYPKELIDLDYPLDFPIRGLLIDKKLGHILKMDRFKHVQKGYHGMRRIEREELRTLYQSKRVRPNTARYHWVDTLYALSKAAIYAKIIDFFESFGHPLDYATLFTDIRETIDEAHRDGTILQQVEADLPRYVEKDPLLAATLHKLRARATGMRGITRPAQAVLKCGHCHGSRIRAEGRGDHPGRRRFRRFTLARARADPLVRQVFEGMRPTADETQ